MLKRVTKEGLTLEEYAALDKYNRSKTVKKDDDSYNAAVINSGSTRNDFDSRVRQNNQAKAEASSGKETEKGTATPSPSSSSAGEEKKTSVASYLPFPGTETEQKSEPIKVISPKQDRGKLGTEYTKVDPAKTEKKEYYSKPVFEETEEEKKSAAAVSASGSALGRTDTLRSAAEKMLAASEKELTESAKIIESYEKQLDALKTQYDVAPTEALADKFNSLLDAYNSACADFEGIKKKYDSHLTDYRDIYQLYSSKYAEYEAQQKKYGALAYEKAKAYEDWLSTIRSSDVVESEVGAVDKAIKELEKKISNEEYYNSIEESQGYYSDEREKQIEKYKTQLAPLLQKKALLDEEFGYAKEKEKAEYYASYTERADFKEKSGFKTKWNSEKPQTPQTVQEYYYGGNAYAKALYDDITYELVNRNALAISISESENQHYLNNIYKDQYLYCFSDEEQAIYNYIYATEGKESADNFVEALKPTLLERWRELKEKGTREWASNNFWKSSLISIITKLKSSSSFAGQIADYIDDGKIDANDTYNAFSHVTSALRAGGAEAIVEYSTERAEALAEKAEDKWGKEAGETVKKIGEAFGQAGAETYGLAMSIVDSSVMAAVGGKFGLVLMSMGAAASSTIEAKDRGLSDEQAIGLGLVSGAAEFFFEKIGFDAIFDTETLGESLKTYLRNAGLTNAMEEGATEITNIFADVIIAGDKSKWKTAMNEYMKNGDMSEGDAFVKVFLENALDVGKATLGGFISGGVMASVPATISYAANKYQKIDAQKTFGEAVLKTEGEMDALLDKALKLPKNSDAYKLAEKINSKIGKGKTPTASEVGKLLSLTLNEKQSLDDGEGADVDADASTDDVTKESADGELGAESSDVAEESSSDEKSNDTAKKTVPEIYEMISDAKKEPIYTEVYKLAEDIDRRANAGEKVTSDEIARLEELWEARQRTNEAKEAIAYAADGGNNSLEKVEEIIRTEYGVDTITYAEIEETYNEAVSSAEREGASSTQTDPYNGISAVEKIKNSIPELSKMESVVTLTGNEFPKSSKKLTEQVGEFFASLKNKITRKGFGDVVIDVDGVQSSIAHGIGRAKSVTFAAVPEVIKNGKQIDYQSNWKDRGYDTYIFAAPVKIGDKIGYVGVVVGKHKSSNRYYLHEVVDSDGNIFKINKDVDLFKTESSADKSASPGKSTPSDTIISKDGDKVNTSTEKSNKKETKGDEKSGKAEKEGTEDLDAPDENEVTRHIEHIEDVKSWRDARDDAREKFYADEAVFIKKLKENGEYDTHPIGKARTETERSGYVYGAEQSDIDVATRLAKKLNRDILFFSEEARNGDIKNGVYDRDTIWINVKRDTEKTAVWVIAHELTHSIEKTKAYSSLKRYVFAELGDEAVAKQRTDLLSSYDRSEVDYEIVSNYVADHLLTDEKAISSLVRSNRSLGEKLLSVVNKILEKLGYIEESISLRDARAIYQRALAEQASGQNTDGARSEQERAKEKVIEPDDVLKYDYIQDLREKLLSGEITEEQFDELYDEYVDGGNSRPRMSKSNNDTLVFTSNFEQATMDKYGIDRLNNYTYVQNRLLQNIPKSFYRSVTNAETGMSVRITTKGIKESFGIKTFLQIPRPLKIAKLATIEMIPEAIERGTVRGEDNDNYHKKHSPLTYVYIYYDIELEGHPCVLKIDVRKSSASNSNRLHLHSIYLENKKVDDIPDSTKKAEDGPNYHRQVEVYHNTTQLSSEKNKKIQLGIITETNPAPNGYLAWIRTENDIKTFEEAFRDDEWADYDEFNPDYTREMAEQALESGQITVYSSYPIENGAFVTPSRMEAESYSGNGKVYSKTVSLSDVAWIDITQGQYAEVSQEAYPFSKKGRKSVSKSENISFSERARSEYQEVTEGINSKGKDYLETQERSFSGRLGEIFSLEGRANNSLARDAARAIVAEKIKNGGVTSEKARDVFEYVYEQATVKDREFYEQYKHVKKHLRSVPITLSSRDMNDLGDPAAFKRSAKGKLDIRNEGGMPVDSFYMELMEEYPELFPADITHPADQLQKMLEVSESIAVKEIGVEEMIGGSAEAKEWMWNDFNDALGQLLRKTSIVEKYIESLGIKMAQEKMTVPDAETLFDTYKNLKKLRKDAGKAVAKNVLTPIEENFVRDLLTGRITVEQIPEDVYNVDSIKAVYEAKKPYENAMKVIAAYHNERKSGQYARADELLDGHEDWKTVKMGLALSVNTMERNFRNVVKDQGRAEELIKEYITPIHSHEALSTRYKNKFLDRIRELGISQKVMKGNKDSEAAAVQFIGEAESHIKRLEDNRRLRESGGLTLEEWETALSDFKIANPELDYGRIGECVKVFREIYNQLFDDMNKARMLNGYEPIDYRYAYFPHFHKDIPTTFGGKFAEMLGIPQDTQNLPATIAGLTENFKPGIRWLSAAQERRMSDTEYDCLEGFDRYIGGAADVIFHTEDIQKFRSLANRVRYQASDDATRVRIMDVEANDLLTDEEKHEQIAKIAESRFTLSAFVGELDEYTNLLAGKKSRSDRGAEQDLGRNFYNISAWFKRRFGANMIAGNLGSAMTNFIPLAQAAGITRGQMLAAMYAQIKSMAVDDGFADRSDFLTNRIVGTEALSKSTSDKISDILGTPMEIIDGFSSGTIVRALYAKAKKDGLSDAEAMAQANERAAEIMADRSKGAMPTLFARSNFFTGIVTQFQLEVANQYNYMFKDLPRYYGGDKRKALKVLASLFKIFLLSYLFNDLYEALVGRRAAFDPIDILNDAIGEATGYKLPNMVDAIVDLTNGEDFGDLFKTEKKGTAAAAKSVWNNALEELPFVGSFVGGGRIPISSAMPDVGKLYDTFTSDASGKKKLQTLADELYSLLYVLPPYGGGQIKKIVKGAENAIKGGAYTVNNDGESQLKYPVTGVGEIAQSVIFGPNATRDAREWVEGGFDTLSAKETGLYNSLIKQGLSKDDAYRAIVDYNELKGSSTRKADQIEAIKELDIPEDAKTEMYKKLIASDSELAVIDERLDIFKSHGLDLEDYMDAVTVELFESEKKTSAFLGLVDEGFDTNDALALLEEYTETAKAASEAYRKETGKTGNSVYKVDSIATILGLSCTDEVKKLIYQNLLLDDPEDVEAFQSKLDDLYGVGIGFGTFLKIDEAHSRIKRNEDDYATVQEMSIEFSRWLNSQNFSKEQQEVIKNNFKYWVSTPVTAGSFDKYVSAGVSENSALLVSSSLKGLEKNEEIYPALANLEISEKEKISVFKEICGEKEASELEQTLEKIKAKGVNFDDYLHIRGVGMSDNYLGAVVELMGIGMKRDEAIKQIGSISELEPNRGRKTLNEYQKAHAAINGVADANAQLKVADSFLGDDTYKKVELAYKEFYITPKLYLEVRDAAEELAYKSTGKTSITNAIAEEVLSDMNIGTGRKAILWTFLTGGSPKNNPFDKEQGQWAEDALESIKD